LLISHDLSIVRHIAHYVYIIHKGEIIDSGKPAALVRNPGHFYTKEIVDLLDPGV